MDIKTLNNFLAVAREENLTQAAARLHLSQPALSRQMMELEKEIGTSLFYRTNRKTCLTEEGLLFQKRAEEMVGLMNRTMLEIAGCSGDVRGTLRIGAWESNQMQFIAKAMRSITMQYPGVSFELYSSSSEDIMEKVEQGRLDFGIVVSRMNMHQMKVLHLPVQERLGLIMKKTDPLAEKLVIRPEDLKNIPLILPMGMKRQDNFLREWMSTDYDMEHLNIAGYFSLIYNAAFLAEEGIGKILSMDHLIPGGTEANLCFRPLYPEVNINLTLIWKQYQRQSRLNDLFIQELLKAFDRPLN